MSETEILRLEINSEPQTPSPISDSYNVFIARTSETAALINGAHPADVEQLLEKLNSEGLTPEDIDRVVHLHWGIRSLGVYPALRQADHFIASPDMVRPRDYDQYIEDTKADLRAIAEEALAEKDGLEDELETFTDWLDEYYRLDGVTSLDFIPLRDGHALTLGALQFEVLETPGPREGHISLFEDTRGILFSGEFAIDGMPGYMADVEEYLVSLEKIMELESETLYPNKGGIGTRPNWNLGRGLRFLDNFMSHAPAAMYRSPTVVDFVENDRGRSLDELRELVYMARQYKGALDELERQGVIESEGTGLEKEYGIDVDDPRGRVHG